jgi:hypothetical protein
LKVEPTDLPRVLGSVLAEVIALLDANAAPYALIGGLAVGVHAQARATKDIDLAVNAGTDAARRVVAAMEARGFVARVHGVPGPGAVVRFSRTGDDGLVRWVDLLFAGTPFEVDAVGRATVETVLGHPIAVVSPEDLLVYKLLAGRPQDVADVVAILREYGPRLDRGHLDRACAAWDLGPELLRLERLAAQAP